MSKLKKNEFKRKLEEIVSEIWYDQESKEANYPEGSNEDMDDILGNFVDQICELIEKEVVEEDEEEVSGCNCGYCRRRDNDVYIRNQLRFEQREIIGREGR